MLPPMQKLIDSPFWLDPGDPHRMRSAIQTHDAAPKPQYVGRQPRSAAAIRFGRAADHRDGGAPRRRRGLSAERAADEGIARIKQILAE
jgi:hypothetical protein